MVAIVSSTLKDFLSSPRISMHPALLKGIGSWRSISIVGKCCCPMGCCLPWVPVDMSSLGTLGWLWLMIWVLHHTPCSRFFDSTATSSFCSVVGIVNRVNMASNASGYWSSARRIESFDCRSWRSALMDCSSALICFGESNVVILLMLM